MVKEELYKYKYAMNSIVATLAAKVQLHEFRIEEQFMGLIISQKLYEASLVLASRKVFHCFRVFSKNLFNL